MKLNKYLRSHLKAHVALAPKLACAPFMGAARSIHQSISRPAHSWQDVARNDVILYFAPLVGAIDGVREFWKARHRKDRSTL